MCVCVCVISPLFALGSGIASAMICSVLDIPFESLFCPQFLCCFGQIWSWKLQLQGYLAPIVAPKFVVLESCMICCKQGSFRFC